MISLTFHITSVPSGTAEVSLDVTSIDGNTYEMAQAIRFAAINRLCTETKDFLTEEQDNIVYEKAEEIAERIMDMVHEIEIVDIILPGDNKSKYIH